VAAFGKAIKEAEVVSSLGDFDKAVNAHVDAWQQMGVVPKLWFRGHARVAWPLTPPALRKDWLSLGRNH
jgi:hypothetical protein